MQGVTTVLLSCCMCVCAYKLLYDAHTICLLLAVNINVSYCHGINQL